MNLLFAASVGDTITDAVAEVAKALRYPVLILALVALAVVAYELGRLAVEAWKRSQRPNTPFDQTARQALAQARGGDAAGAQATLRAYSYGDTLQKAAVGTLFAQNAIDAQRAVIDYDLYVSKRLDRTRLLVRAGPALGLMGTLIPLAPALSALGKGDPQVLADELQTAFAITVVGVAVGLIAFTVALIRERYYTKDLADLEFLREIRGDAAIFVPATAPQVSASPPAHQTATDQPIAASQSLPPETPAAAQPVGKPEAATQAMPAVTPPPPAATAPPAAPIVPPASPAPGVIPPAFPPAAEPPKKKKGFGIKKKTPPPTVPPTAFPPPPPAVNPAVGTDSASDATGPSPHEEPESGSDEKKDK